MRIYTEWAPILITLTIEAISKVKMLYLHLPRILEEALYQTAPYCRRDKKYKELRVRQTKKGSTRNMTTKNRTMREGHQLT